MVEEHWDTIAARVIHQIRNDPLLFHIRKLPDSELRLWGQALLKNLGHWLVESNEQEITHRYESQGRLRYQEGIPLHEVVQTSALLKRGILDYIRDQGLCQTSVEVYAEEELEHQVGAFFDSAIFHLVRGYEAELRHAVHIAV
jgi:hypothetical protein